MTLRDYLGFLLADYAITDSTIRWCLRLSMLPNPTSGAIK